LPKVLIKTPFLRKLAIHLALPLLLLYYSVESQFLLPTEANGLTKRVDGKHSILKNGCIGPAIPLEKLKNVARHYKVSINDVIMTVTSNVLKAYLSSIGDPDTTYMNIGVPFSLRTDSKLDNQFALLPFRLPLTETFESGLPAVKAEMDRAKVSPAPYGYYYLIALLVTLPRFLSQTLLESFSKKCSIVFSNVAGTRKPYVVAGSQVKHQSFYVPCMMKLSGGIAVVSHADSVKLSLLLDKRVIDDPQVMMNMYNDKFDEILREF